MLTRWIAQTNEEAPLLSARQRSIRRKWRRESKVAPARTRGGGGVGGGAIGGGGGSGSGGGGGSGDGGSGGGLNRDGVILPAAILWRTFTVLNATASKRRGLGTAESGTNSERQAPSKVAAAETNGYPQQPELQDDATSQTPQLSKPLQSVTSVEDAQAAAQVSKRFAKSMAQSFIQVAQHQAKHTTQEISRGRRYTAQSAGGRGSFRREDTGVSISGVGAPSRTARADSDASTASAEALASRRQCLGKGRRFSMGGSFTKKAANSDGKAPPGAAAGMMAPTEHGLIAAAKRDRKRGKRKATRAVEPSATPCNTRDHACDGGPGAEPDRGAHQASAGGEGTAGPASPPSTPLPPAPLRFLCDLCGDPDDEEDQMPVEMGLALGCGHVWCQVCLNGWIEAKVDLRDINDGDVNCPATGCNVLLSEEQIRCVLVAQGNTRLMERRNRLRDEAFIEGEINTGTYLTTNACIVQCAQGDRLDARLHRYSIRCS